MAVTLGKIERGKFYRGLCPNKAVLPEGFEYFDEHPEKWLMAKGPDGRMWYAGEEQLTLQGVGEDGRVFVDDREVISLSAASVKVIDKISACARCGKEHVKVVAIQLFNPPEGITHFSICPETKQPILVSIT